MELRTFPCPSGGTIAGSGSSSSSTTGYSIGSVTVSALINAVPQVLNISNVAGVQISNVGSEDITSTVLLKLAKQINEVICGDPTMSGAVVTHGTDTLEETAFFLDSTITCGKPVVMVGAMRPSTAISADGPSNLLQAVTVAVDPDSKDRGTMVVLNDRIASAFYITKNNANTLETFKPVEQGFLGVLVSDEAFYYYPPVTPTGKRSFSIASVTSIPRVDILYSYQDMQNDTLYNAVSSGAKGIVVSTRLSTLPLATKQLVTLFYFHARTDLGNFGSLDRWSWGRRSVDIVQLRTGGCHESLQDPDRAELPNQCR